MIGIHYKSILSDGIKPVKCTAHHNLESVTLVTKPEAYFIAYHGVQTSKYLHSISKPFSEHKVWALVKSLHNEVPRCNS